MGVETTFNQESKSWMQKIGLKDEKGHLRWGKIAVVGISTALIFAAL